MYHLISHLFTQLQTLTPAIRQASNNHSTALVNLPETCPESPIFAILSTHPRSLAAHCQAAGFIVRPVVAPTVPRGTERVRVCLHSGNTKEQIDSFVACVRSWLDKQALNPEAADITTQQLTAQVESEQRKPHERPFLAKL